MRPKTLPSKLTTKLLIEFEVDAFLPSFNNEAQMTPSDEESPRNNSPHANEIEISFEDNNVYVALTQTAFLSMVPSTSKVLHHLRLTSSSEDMNFEDQVDNQENQDQGVDASQDFKDGEVNRNS